MTERDRESTEFSEDDDRVSLAPLDAETALRALLAVKPGEPPPDGESAENQN